ncbi:MAG: hypothetical protein IJS67_00190 [Clostridia bacterium]|nr:hypothetical protein [Clostridia bacterium]
MNISGEKLKNRWVEATGFDFQKLLEDNQELSLPSVTLLDGKPVIFAFVYSNCLSRTVVSQRHFWDMKTHKFMLCKNVYEFNLSPTENPDRELYIQQLSKVADLLFKDTLTEEEGLLCKQFFSLFEDEKIRKVYFCENKPLFKWVSQQNLLY